MISTIIICAGVVAVATSWSEYRIHKKDKKIDDLTKQYNKVAESHNDVLEENQDLAYAHNRIVDKYNELGQKYNKLIKNNNELLSLVEDLNDDFNLLYEMLINIYGVEKLDELYEELKKAKDQKDINALLKTKVKGKQQV